MRSDVTVGPALATRRPRAPLARRLLSSHGHSAATAAVVLLGFVVWDRLATVVNPILLAPPDAVFAALGELVGTGSFWSNVSVTAREMLIGWGIGVSSGIAMALVTVRWSRIRAALYPYIVVFFAMPKVVLLPLFATWLGIGQPSTIALIVVSTFFPTYLNSFIGLSQVTDDALALMRSLGARPRQVFRMLLVPGAMPMVFTGLKASMTIAALGAVIGEFYGARDGLGFLINSYAYSLQTDYVYAVIIAVSVLALVLYFAVELLQRLVIRWPSAKS